jgi:glycine dehydrogenase
MISNNESGSGDVKVTLDLFARRHIGVDGKQEEQMLQALGFSDLESFISAVIPNHLLSVDLLKHSNDDKINASILNNSGMSEEAALTQLKILATQNKECKNYIGMGYYDTITPSVIKRNVFENPGWYTAYTPYQAEIAQGRLEALLNFQQMIIDLTGFNLANASLLDEATAGAEAMSMARRINNVTKGQCYFVSNNVFPQTLDVIRTRAKYQDIEVVVGDLSQFNPDECFGVFIQNPGFYGELIDYTTEINAIKQANPACVVVMACDILSLVLFKSPKQMGADIALGSTQRFGIPLGFGGPSAGYIATSDLHKRIMPGRIIGVSVDSRGKKALRMSLQTREQHIRREKATSNICTSQVLLANMAAFYAIYHGAEGLKQIAGNIHRLTLMLTANLIKLGIKIINQGNYRFDTIVIELKQANEIYVKLIDNGYAVGLYNDLIWINIGERANIVDVVELFNLISDTTISLTEFEHNAENNEVSTTDYNMSLYRKDDILTHPVFTSYHSETKMMRYLKQLENKDLSLVHSMIALGSCTMKLNAACELEGLSWGSFAHMHPFAPKANVMGYITMMEQLAQYLQEITGFSAVSLQPNSGAQGEFAGLLAIRRYQESIGEVGRNVCLIPKSAHGTNPATAQMMGMDVVVVNCDANGNIDVDDLLAKAEQYAPQLSCLMVTYPSTHGVFEESIKEICTIIHNNGGQVYMDGANLNALVGLVKPAQLGADVSHINLHKTFAIPHGGGGPGMGPIGVQAHLAPFLPGHGIIDTISNNYINNKTDPNYNAVSSSPYGSASILLISWMYITLLGKQGLQRATKIAILNANYIAKALKPYYPILYTGQNGFAAHECIIDLRPFKEQCGISEVDIAKRLIDYGFHAPTMSFPVAGTLMIEPTESEDKGELDRFIRAMTSIYHEIKQVEQGIYDRLNNPLKNAPHSLADVMLWDKPYSVEIGCFPMVELKQHKIFPSVNRIDDAHGDRNFICSCVEFAPVDEAKSS